MSNLTTIETIKTNTLNAIASITAKPQPSYSIDGQSVSHDQHLANLLRTVEWCNEQLANEDPFEIVTQGVT
jgi:hypothetical protein